MVESSIDNVRIIVKVDTDGAVDMVENDIFASLLYPSLFLSPCDAIPFQIRERTTTLA